MSKQDMPVSLYFDDLIRHYDHLNNFSCENEFYEFALNQEANRNKWGEAEKECVRLQNSLKISQEESNRQEKKILETRRLLETKLDNTSRLEIEKERLELRINSACSLINTFLQDNRISPDTQERLLTLNNILQKGETKNWGNRQSPGALLDTISEADTTDLSLTQSEDDLDLSRGRRSRRKKRPSLDEPDRRPGILKKTKYLNIDDDYKKGTKQVVEVTTNEKIITTTTVTRQGEGGPAHAVATIETIPIYSNSKAALINPPSYQSSLAPSAPTLSSGTSEGETATDSEFNYKLTTPKKESRTEYQSPNRFGKTLSSTGPMALRQHSFSFKTVIKPESCDPCGKRIKFSKMALKCKECKATCHPECKDKVPLPCVSISTPGNNKHHIGSLADYAPSSHPMVPSLIQHCINEIEVRGLNVVGIYRIPGAEREVKELKEKFLRNKGIPTLGKYDIHSICGCLKDFLRSLSEPLLGRWLWKDFTRATDILDPFQRADEFKRITLDLALPNQDTLSFMIMHLHRVAEASRENKMPIENLSKIFGPTIVGYSSLEVQPLELLKETRKQQAVMLGLLQIPQNFWSDILCRPEEQGKVYPVTRSRSKQGSKASSNQVVTPKNRYEQLKESGRRIYFSEVSPKDKPPRQKKKYFD